MHLTRDHIEKTCETCGVRPDQVEATDAALLSLIDNYCREAWYIYFLHLFLHFHKIGRHRASCFMSIYRIPVTSEVVGSDMVDKVSVDVSNLANFEGKPAYQAEHVYDQTSIGVVWVLRGLPSVAQHCPLWPP
ncbi:unnamed protein product [Musa hybrid cultivar]